MLRSTPILALASTHLHPQVPSASPSFPTLMQVARPATFSPMRQPMRSVPLGYSSSVRNVPQSEKKRAYAEYGITSHTTGQYEVDHFIPLELGGSNDISNLWPEPANPTPGFHQKDKVENYLHAQVCSGAMTLSAAQDAISSDWVAVYNSIS